MNSKRSLPGSLRHRGRIERRTDIKDSYGEARATWATLATVWARVRDESQREFNAALHVQDQKGIAIEIRDPRVEVRPADRFVWLRPTGNRTLDIRAVLAGENIVGGTITLMCVEHSE